MFWFLAIAISAVTGLVACWSLLRSGGMMRSAGFGLVALGVVLSMLLYREIGTPDGLNVDGRPSQQPSQTAHSPDQAQMEALLQQLEQRLQENTDDLEGWVILGRSYKTMQRYAESVAALEQAWRLAPDNALVMVELAEARMFASGNPQVGEREIELLEQALVVDPQIQKGLWLLGIAAAQSGRTEVAVDYWSRLLAQMEPGSNAAMAIEERIAELGDISQVSPPAAAGWPGVKVSVTAPSADFEAPPGSALFVIARRPGGGGPPLGVERIDNPRFPVTVSIDDSDSMMQQVPVSSIPTIELLARLSRTGQAAAGEGDLNSQAIQIGTDEPRSVVLELGFE